LPDDTAFDQNNDNINKIIEVVSDGGISVIVIGNSETKRVFPQILSPQPRRFVRNHLCRAAPVSMWQIYLQASVHRTRGLCEQDRAFAAPPQTMRPARRAKSQVREMQWFLDMSTARPPLACDSNI